MKIRSFLALAGLSLFACAPAMAADNLAAKDNTGTAFKYRAFDLGGSVYLPAHALVDPATGAVMGVAANPLAVGLAAGAATDAKLEAVRALLASPLTFGLPTGAATDAKLEAVRALLAAPLTIGLPTGAATAAKQPALGTAGAPSGDVLSAQGVLNGIPLNVDTVVRSASTSRSTIIPVAGVTAAPVAGGTGHAVGDILTLTGGTCTVQPRFNVATVSSGAVATTTLNTAGSCTVLPTVPAVTTSSGAGTGATLNPAWASISTQIMAANLTRRGIQVQPQGNIAYMSGLSAATADQNSLKLPADALYDNPPTHVGTGAINLICACSVPLAVYGREY